mmetsp:Transcript_18432/g.29968  ORF Transcript_18432/g.29968 Transcript_18432/m.29968 type:complete len:246 (-) Transcript_18432:261-998(-)
MKIDGIWRHPIKSHGREALDAVDLYAGQNMPWDRVWAVAHDASKAKPGTWASYLNFSRVAQAPALMAITAVLNEEEGTLTLSHPGRPDLTFDPDAEPGALIEWTAPLVPQNRALPSHIMRLDHRGYTDSNFASITLCNHASHRAVEAQMDQSLSIHRWRGNFWFESDTPWIEFEWLGVDVQLGEAIIRPCERTLRCRATTANPETGRIDADTLDGLNAFGHQDFSVRCEVIKSGRVQLNDSVVLL